MKLSVIDIGSNSVRLMTWADGTVLYKTLASTRLSQGLACGFLSAEAMERTAQAVNSFYLRAMGEGAEEVLCFATAAVRSAQNGGEFCKRVKALCNLTVDVVSGEEEASLGLLGALKNAPDGGMIDIGGASTEVCMRKGGKIAFSTSIDLGAVRLFERCGREKDMLLSVIHESLSPLERCRPQGNVFAVGGTATTLGALDLKLERYDGKKIQNYTLTREGVFSWAERLLALSVEEIRALVGMDEKRADIIGGGALLLACAMQKLSLNGITLSDSDNLEGYLAKRRGV